MKQIIFIFGILVCCPLLAADWPIGPAYKHAYLEVIISNTTSQDVHATEVFFGPKIETFGVVGAGVEKGYLYWETPITTNAIISWTDFSKVKCKQTVPLLGIYDPKVAGKLIFTIGVTNVTAKFKKID